MKRALLATAAIAAMVATAAPAGADFHLTTQACTQQVGNAHVFLEVTESGFTYSGDVICKGATSASITSLTIKAVTPGATTDSASTDTPVTCTFPCSDPLFADGEAPAAIGVTEVLMRFTATGPTKTFNTARRARYLYLGTGDPIVLCGSGATAGCGN